MARNMHKYEELTPYEFNQEKERRSIIYLASGPLEFHEECNALGIDAFKGYDWCLGAVEKTGGIVFPAIPLGPCVDSPRFEGDHNYQEREDIRKFYKGEKELFATYAAPSLFTSKKLCHALFMELLENFAQDLHFKLCVFVGTHGPSGDLCRDIVKELGGSIYGMEVMAVGTLQYNIDLVQKFYKENNIPRISHGGMWESAFNYAMNPEFVQTKYLDAKKYPQCHGALTEEFYEGCIRPIIPEYDKLTPEFAKTLRDTTVERLAAAVNEKYDAILAKEKA